MKRIKGKKVKVKCWKKRLSKETAFLPLRPQDFVLIQTVVFCCGCVSCDLASFHWQKCSAQAHLVGVQLVWDKMPVQKVNFVL